VSAARKRSQRRALLERDGPWCTYCGRLFGTGLPFSRPTLDHVVPRSRGGSSALVNLVLACKPCNRDKGDLSSAEFQPVAS
jgi:5-methylcytosine-specific restriction endonuclease McrA